MITKPFQFIAVDSLETAEGLLVEHGSSAKVIAGGTDLIGTLKDNIHPDYPKLLIGLKSAQNSAFIIDDSAGIRIGALTTLSQIYNDPIIRQKIPMLSEAAASVASPQIRNVATIAGNLCQEPRLLVLP